METFKFKKNYNNKLCCGVFTTIRPHKPSRKPGDIVGIELLEERNEYKGKAKIRHIATARLKDIPEQTFAVDCGMDKKLSMELFRDIYKPYGLDADTMMFDIIVLTHHFESE
jgi:hypothetical protein